MKKQHKMEIWDDLGDATEESCTQSHHAQSRVCSHVYEAAAADLLFGQRRASGFLRW